MKPKPPTLILLSSLAAAAAGLTGCASTAGPTNNTGRDAVAGAAAGAVLGGIIGNNTGGSGGRGAVIGAAAGGLAGAAYGKHQDTREAGVYSNGAPVTNAAYPGAPVTSDNAIVVQTPPPSPTSQPYENVPPQPAANTTWIPGHWNYTGAGYTWDAGRWETPPAGARVWLPPSWQPQNGGYVYVGGHWQ